MPATALTIYQPLIVGLGAVVLGLITNTLLEWFRHSLNARHQRGMVRKALLAELQIARGLAEHNRLSVGATERAPGQMLQMPIREDYPAFKWATPQLGLLSRTEIAAVFEAYDYLNSWHEVIVLVGTLERIDGKQFAHVRSDRWDIIADAAEDRVGRLDTAIGAIKQKLGTA